MASPRRPRASASPPALPRATGPRAERASTEHPSDSSGRLRCASLSGPFAASALRRIVGTATLCRCSARRAKRGIARTATRPDLRGFTLGSAGPFGGGFTLGIARLARGRRAEEVAQQIFAVFGEDALGVELDTVDGILAVTHAHDHAAVGVRGDFE